jgi:hypothetical protein
MSAFTADTVTPRDCISPFAPNASTNGPATPPRTESQRSRSERHSPASTTLLRRPRPFISRRPSVSSKFPRCRLATSCLRTPASSIKEITAQSRRASWPSALRQASSNRRAWRDASPGASRRAGRVARSRFLGSCAGTTPSSGSSTGEVTARRSSSSTRRWEPGDSVSRAHCRTTLMSSLPSRRHGSCAAAPRLPVKNSATTSNSAFMASREVRDQRRHTHHASRLVVAHPFGMCKPRVSTPHWIGVDAKGNDRSFIVASKRCAPAGKLTCEPRRDVIPAYEGALRRHLSARQHGSGSASARRPF